METWLNKLPLPAAVKDWVLLPLWHAILRLSKPEVRIVSGGISFYALFSVFPLIYLTLALLFSLLPHDLSESLSSTIDQVLISAVAPLKQADLTAIRDATPQGLTVRAFIAILIVFYTASSGAKAAITGIRMVAGSEKRSNIIRFQGVSLLMTTLLICLVWLLGALQLLMSFVTERQGIAAFELAQRISELASQLWIGKFLACFAIFYLIISLSLHGRISSGRAMTAGAAAGALSWAIATWAYHLYLRVSVLDTFYGALASVILGFIWLLVSVSSLLLGAALTVEWARRISGEGLDPDEAIASSEDDQLAK
ncbi:YihY/virulence factor BrkB family protein [Henriciella mobilis]|uniref:YhjD/YihY/BrkB family envelope integrity protein n=1 Tax=Henriciella mobilis TaxID=2305467 RepID=UPI000E66616A|nr:YhjD/YihY/BrkB family envelope integrity protein [Henriciella mobilis]RIJ18233.1 YihY/virulence factor BrkB family protein [Henriciella mobilis]RIJ24959.1 YihY/virulence factor BrkB family protein [Henriciella mobilis]